MLKNQVTFRRVTAGVLLIVAPLLQAVAVVVDPGTWGDDREAVSFGDNPVLAQVQSALYHWSWMLMAVAVLGLVHFTRRRASVLGHVSGGLTILGYLALSALLMIALARSGQQSRRRTHLNRVVASPDGEAYDHGLRTDRRAAAPAREP